MSGGEQYFSVYSLWECRFVHIRSWLSFHQLGYYRNLIREIQSSTPTTCSFQEQAYLDPNSWIIWGCIETALQNPATNRVTPKWLERKAM